ncbi:hypothetical protein HELRODRAFT_67780, partial [Helobdella robusta]|uniref:Tyrosine-protein phosphatase domain-containing protein n=1 Tax=Helobdella robusta TaxID=6412 RepID=T1FZ50_HELRO
EKKIFCLKGPQLNTVNDFWRMIVEVGVEVVVMLTPLEENGKVKCQKYWSDKETLNINILEGSGSEDFLLITLKGLQNSQELTVTHLKYNSWPDLNVPENVGSLLNFQHVMQTLVNKINSGHSSTKVLTHCSAGVGRTGTFIALDHLIRQAVDVEAVDVYKCLKLLRSYRNHMIQAVVCVNVCVCVCVCV